MGSLCCFLRSSNVDTASTGLILNLALAFSPRRVRASVRTRCKLINLLRARRLQRTFPHRRCVVSFPAMPRTITPRSPYVKFCFANRSRVKTEVKAANPGIDPKTRSVLTALELANLWKQSSTMRETDLLRCNNCPVPPLNLYLVEWSDASWDQYRSITVAAKNEESARKIHPHFDEQENWELDDPTYAQLHQVWADYAEIKHLVITHIGTALPSTEKGVIASDFYNG